MSGEKISGERRAEMEDILLALRTAWFAYPQLRLGQLVSAVKAQLEDNSHQEGTTSR